MSEKKKRQITKKPVRTKKSKTVFPQQKTYPATQETGSMSEGNLSNNPKGRTRSRRLHSKTFVMGTDSDGQAD